MTLANGLVLGGEWNWIRIKYFGHLMHDYDLVFEYIYDWLRS